MSILHVTGLLLASLALLAQSAVALTGDDQCSSPVVDLIGITNISAVTVLAVDEIEVDGDGLPTGRFWPRQSALTWAVFGDAQDYYLRRDQSGTGYAYSPSLANAVLSNESFSTIVDWLCRSHSALGIDFVSFLGDIVEHGQSAAEWMFASNQVARLEAEGLPCFIAPGNHDTCWGDTSAFSRHFSAARFAAQGGEDFSYESFGGFVGTNWMHYADGLKAATCDEDILTNGLFDSASDVGPVGGNGANDLIKVRGRDGRTRLFFHLQCSAPAPVIDWVNTRLTAPENATNDAFIVIHEHVGRVNYKLPYNSPSARCNIGRQRSKRFAQNQCASAQYHWERCFSKHPNVKMVLCGHEPEGLSEIFSERGEFGNTVLEIVQNYPQIWYSTWVRLYRLDAEGRKLYAYTYSPHYHRLCRGDEVDFVHGFNGDTFEFATNCPHHFVIDLDSLSGSSAIRAQGVRTVGDDYCALPYFDLRPMKDGLAYWNADQSIVSRVRLTRTGDRLLVTFRVLDDYHVMIKNAATGRKEKWSVNCPISRYAFRLRYGDNEVVDIPAAAVMSVVETGRDDAQGSWRLATIDALKTGINLSACTNASVTIVLNPR